MAGNALALGLPPAHSGIAQTDTVLADAGHLARLGDREVAHPLLGQPFLLALELAAGRLLLSQPLPLSAYFFLFLLDAALWSAVSRISDTRSW